MYVDDGVGSKLVKEGNQGDKYTRTRQGFDVVTMLVLSVLYCGRRM